MPLMHWIRSIKPEVKCSRYLTQRSGGLIGKRIRNEMGLLAPKILPRQHVHSDIKEVVKPFDWSYSTDYKGSITYRRLPGPGEESSLHKFEQTDRKLPIELLSRPDPILFFSNIDLFEDELADNGMSLLTVKVRVMPRRLLLLSRFFLRLDDVIFRIRDTRVYIEFETGEVIREYTAREEKYDAIKSQLGSAVDATSFMRDPDQLAKVCPIVETSLEGLLLPHTST